MAPFQGPVQGASTLWPHPFCYCVHPRQEWGVAERGLSLPLAGERGQQTPSGPVDALGLCPVACPPGGAPASGCGESRPLSGRVGFLHAGGGSGQVWRGAQWQGRVPGWVSPSWPLLPQQCVSTTASLKRGSTTWSLICKCQLGVGGGHPTAAPGVGSEASPAPGGQAPTLGPLPSRQHPCLLFAPSGPARGRLPAGSSWGRAAAVSPCVHVCACPVAERGGFWGSGCLSLPAAFRSGELILIPDSSHRAAIFSVCESLCLGTRALGGQGP